MQAGNMSAICLVALFVVNTVLAKSILRYNPEDASDHFETFIRTYDKEYDETEKAKRLEIFMKNLEEINDLNKQSDSAVFGITQFTDLTTEEFIQQYTGYKPSNNTFDKTKPLRHRRSKINLKLKDIPESFDWRDKGVVTPVRNQGNCSAGWAFSIIGNVESAYAIKTNQSVILSEQQLVNCANNHGDGCSGGNPWFACKYLMSKGSMSEDSYPYEAKNGPCRYNESSVKVKVNNCTLCDTHSEDELAHTLTTIGPLTVFIDARAIKKYTGGIITNSMCKPVKINHEVLLVGFGKGDKGIPYWVVKNSWGTQWGEKGYFRMQRGVNCLAVMAIPAITAIV